MAANIYTTCGHTKRTIPDLTVDQEIGEAIGKNYRTLPLFEKGLFEHKYIHHYSLKNNEYLSCRWREYVMKYESRIIAPFTFVDIRDLHFYNGNIRLLPALSIHKMTDFRQKMKPGPGVDFRGQRPIPDESIMKRTAKSPRPKPLLKRKGKNAEVQVGFKKAGDAQAPATVTG